jgi:cysteinyl-tRNA synthetase
MKLIHLNIQVYINNVKKGIIIFGLVVSAIFGCSFKNNQKEPKDKIAGKKMQQFVIDISKYTKSINPNFLIIPQNGAELTFKDVDPSLELNNSYLNAIDGIGIEELFYDSHFKQDNYRLKMLQQIRKTKPVFVSEVIENKKDITEAISKNKSEGFICFPRTKNNYHYHSIPEIHNENSASITTLSEVKNYLYLISSDNFNTKKDFIDAVSNTNFDLLIIDLYYLSFPFTKADIELLKTKKNGGKRLVISYINIGAAEKWRDYWQPNWKLGNPSWLKKKYPDYDNEIIVEYWNLSWQKIIYKDKDSYLKKILDTGFDGAYLDNVEAYYSLYH